MEDTTQKQDETINLEDIDDYLDIDLADIDKYLDEKAEMETTSSRAVLDLDHDSFVPKVLT